jgi:sec-independent protein translocase protein TatA
MELSITHLLFLLVVIMIFFGPSRLPALGKSLGESLRSLKNAMNNPELDVTESSKKAERERVAEEAKKKEEV